MNELERVVSTLVRNIESRFPGYLEAPFRVQEIHEQLIPYRIHRRELGVETNEYYELALTRLLSGEGGYVLAPEEVRSALQSELQSPNPDSARFKEFGNVDVKLSELALAVTAVAATPAAIAATNSASESTLGAGTNGAAPKAVDSVENRAASKPVDSITDSAAPKPVDAIANSATPDAIVASPTDAAMAPPVAATASPGAPGKASIVEAIHITTESPTPAITAAIRSEVKVPPARKRAPSPFARSPRSSPTASSKEKKMPSSQRTTTSAALGGTCRYCHGVLPDGRELTYCPHCGQDLTVYHCPACSTELELGWKFCVTCGRGVEE